MASQTVGGEELKAEILKRTPQPRLRILVPALCSRAHYLTSDVDREITEAHARLDVMLGWAHRLGFDAVGTVGDANPLIAIEDELRRFGADEVIIATRARGRSHWLQARTVECAQAELEIPVTHVIVRGPDHRHRFEHAA